MKLLLDENLSRRLVPFLQTEFPESTPVTLVLQKILQEKGIACIGLGPHGID